MSFEMILISDQLRVLVGFNYAGVDIVGDVLDDFGQVVHNQLG